MFRQATSTLFTDKGSSLKDATWSHFPCLDIFQNLCAKESQQRVVTTFSNRTHRDQWCSDNVCHIHSYQMGLEDRHSSAPREVTGMMKYTVKVGAKSISYKCVHY